MYTRHSDLQRLIVDYVEDEAFNQAKRQLFINVSGELVSRVDNTVWDTAMDTQIYANIVADNVKYILH